MIKLGVISLEHPHSYGNHFPALRYIHDRVRVTAIAHSDKKAAQPWLDLFSAQYFSDRDELLEKAQVDAVLITSRNNQHANDSIAATRAGKDIFCDKPIATTVTDLRKMATAVREAGVNFVTTFPVRFNTSVRELKHAIDAGELGRIKAIMATNHGCMYEPDVLPWVKDPEQNGGGSLVDHTVHVADMIRWLTGEEFATVRAQTATALRPIPAEDISVLHGQMTDGMIYQIDSSWSRRGRDPMWGDVTCRVVGTKGSASLDLYNNQRVEIYSDKGVSFKYPNHLCREHGEIFLDYVSQRECGTAAIAADEIDGLRTMELVFAAYESVGNNETVKLDLWNQ